MLVKQERRKEERSLCDELQAKSHKNLSKNGELGSEVGSNARLLQLNSPKQKNIARTFLVY